MSKRLPSGVRNLQADWKPVDFVVPTVVERAKTPTISSVWGDRREGLAQRYYNWRVWWRGECKVAAGARRRSQQSKSVTYNAYYSIMCNSPERGAGAKETQGKIHETINFLQASGGVSPTMLTRCSIWGKSADLVPYTLP